MTPALGDVPGLAAQFVAAAAVLSGVVALAATRRPALALGILLDMLVAAGLLRLLGDPTWEAIATAAIAIAIRHLVTYGLRLGARSWHAGQPDPGSWPRSSTHLTARLLRPAWRR